MSRKCSVRLAVANLFIVVALVLATSALDHRAQRHKRAIGRNVTHWNQADKFIPSYLWLLSREPFIKTRYVGNFWERKYEMWGYDYHFAGFGMFGKHSSSTSEFYLMANVESMILTCSWDENNELRFRGWDRVRDRPVMRSNETTWHALNTSYIVKHLLTFGQSGYGLYSLKAPPGMSRTQLRDDNIQSRDVQTMEFDAKNEYKYCWAYSMMHEYFDEPGSDKHPENYKDDSPLRFWGRWPVELVGCKKSMCQFRFDRYFWTNEPNRTDVKTMPEDMKAQAFPCGWQDTGAPIYCAKEQEDEYNHYALRGKMRLKYIIVRSEVSWIGLQEQQPEPKHCYETRSYDGNFTALSLQKIGPFIYKYMNLL